MSNKIFYIKNGSIDSTDISRKEFLRFLSLPKTKQAAEIKTMTMVHAFSMGETPTYRLSDDRSSYSSTEEKVNMGIDTKNSKNEKQETEKDVCKNSALLSPTASAKLQELVKTAGTYYLVDKLKNKNKLDRWRVGETIPENKRTKTTKNKKVNENQEKIFSHHEVGGLLSLVKRNDKYIIGTVNSSFEDGDKNGTNVPVGIAGFHTHPKGEYKRQDVTYAWPSGDDYHSILEKMIKEDCILHIVATMEGIYCISFSPELARLSKIDWKKMFKEKKTAEYKFALPQPGDRHSTPENYIKGLKNMKIFTVEFRKWSSKKPFTFYYPRGINGSCKV